MIFINHKMAGIALLTLSMMLSCTFLEAQEIAEPNYGLKNPGTIELIRVRITPTQTLVDMSIQNELRDGYFCIDEDTFLERGNELEMRLKEVIGLPACPERYEFRSVGEKVYFTLVFDKLPAGVRWFDIIEYCDVNCFSVLAVNLDEEINQKINSAFNAMDRMEAERAINIFRDILPSLQSSQHGLTGSVYLNLVELLAANNMADELQQIISQFKSSPMPHKEAYLAILRSMGY